MSSLSFAHCLSHLLPLSPPMSFYISFSPHMVAGGAAGEASGSQLRSSHHTGIVDKNVIFI